MSGTAVPAVTTSVSVVLDRPGSLEVLEQDRLDVENQLGIVADDHPAAGELVLPGDAEVMAVDRGVGLEADAAHLALVLLADPERRLPLPQRHDAERDRPCHTPNRQLDLTVEGSGAGALREAPGERDLRVVLDIEEVGAAQVLVAVRLAGPDPGGVDLAFEGRVQALVPVELEPSVDVFEQAAYLGEHHVTGAELGLGVPWLEDPGRH